MALLIVAIATALFVVTAWFARSTFASTSAARTKRLLLNVFHVDIGDTLTILAILSGVTGRAMAIVLDKTLESIQWGFTSREKGVPVLAILALSPTTGAWGSAGILFGKKSDLAARHWSGAK